MKATNNNEVVKMKEKELVILKGKDCAWCDDVVSLLSLIDKRHVILSIDENKMANALAKKLCRDKQSCLLIDGKPMNQPNLDKICDEILED
jgi:hypothetical protein